MTRALRLLVGAAVALAAALGLAALSNFPVRVHEMPDARLRVAFSARPERIETCRRPSAEEEANVPAHMRQTEICEGTTARYRLEVRRDDSLLVTMLVRGGGLRHDRQLYVLRDVAVPTGRATVDVRLTRLDSSAARRTRAERSDDPGEAHEKREGDDDDGDRGDARRRRMADEVPPVLHFRDTVELRPREVLLVTYDQSRRLLRAARGGP
ncbi:MAG TPA: hypothetical protein VFS59_06935 [Gemmatimonadaceae bacterium]|nr:hypothetical protein [Gemmatimonadaceae bacterium]